MSTLHTSPGSPAAETRSAAIAEQAVRSEIREWLAGNWDPELSLVEWRSRLVDSGWLVPTWPVEWFGKGLAGWAGAVAADEIRKAGAVGPPLGVGMSLAGPTILDHGPDTVRARFLRRMLTGEDAWCQLFSEPGAGSDLAGLTTTAVRDGDEWVVNGQKLWNTSANHADYGILVARTDWGVPKHRGLTYFVLPMHQDGVAVRPLRQMNRHSSFNEVFMTDARIPADLVVGAPGEGWRVALTTLSYERRFGAIVRDEPAGEPGRAHEEADREAAEFFKSYVWYPQRAGRADLLVEHARRQGRLEDPVVRDALMDAYAVQQVAKWTAQRAQDARAAGRTPGAEGSIGKLAMSKIAKRCAAVHSMLAGASGMIDGTAAPFGGIIAEVLISVPAQSIAGGTDEIQHNIIGEQVLGLPREPAADRELPFRDVPRNG